MKSQCASPSRASCEQQRMETLGSRVYGMALPLPSQPPDPGFTRALEALHAHLNSHAFLDYARVFHLATESAIDVTPLQFRSERHAVDALAPPPLDGLLRLALAITRWLEADAKNVAVLTSHGLDRVHLAAAAARLVSRNAETAEKAMGQMRALLSPSQRRYVTYLETLWAHGLVLTAPRLVLTSVRVDGMATYGTVRMSVSDARGNLLFETEQTPRARQVFLLFELRAPLQADFRLAFLQSGEPLVSVTLHTHFVHRLDSLTLGRHELDCTVIAPPLLALEIYAEAADAPPVPPQQRFQLTRQSRRIFRKPRSLSKSQLSSSQLGRRGSSTPEVSKKEKDGKSEKDTKDTKERIKARKSDGHVSSHPHSHTHAHTHPHSHAHHGSRSHSQSHSPSHSPSPSRSPSLEQAPATLAPIPTTAPVIGEQAAPRRHTDVQRRERKAAEYRELYKRSRTERLVVATPPTAMPPLRDSAPADLREKETQVLELKERERIRVELLRSALRPQQSHVWEIDPMEVDKGRRIAQGATAIVYRARFRGQKVALKEFTDEASAQGEALDSLRKEFAVISAIRAPNVMLFFGAVLRPSLSLVLELCERGSLFDVLNDGAERITWKRVLYAACDTASGIACLHGWRPEIVHRDLKSLNLLVSRNWTVKVGDFGTSRFTWNKEGALLSNLAKVKGTYAYTPPELFFGELFTAKGDTYAYGIVLWELTTRLLEGRYLYPYYDTQAFQRPFQILVQAATKSLRPKVHPSVPPPLAALMRACWHEKAEERPTAMECVKEMKSLLRLYRDDRDIWDALVPASTAGMHTGHVSMSSTASDSSVSAHTTDVLPLGAYADAIIESSSDSESGSSSAASDESGSDSHSSSTVGSPRTPTPTPIAGVSSTSSTHGTPVVPHAHPSPHTTPKP